MPFYKGILSDCDSYNTARYEQSTLGLSIQFNSSLPIKIFIQNYDILVVTSHSLALSV